MKSPFIAASSEGIQGVGTSARPRILDERGGVFPMLRRDDPQFEGFGEIYFSMVNPGVAKGFHWHEKSVSHYLVITGAIQLVFFDERSDSPSKNWFQTFKVQASEGRLVRIPSQIWYAFRGLGSHPSIIANCATLAHDPKESRRRPLDDPDFAFDWTQE